MNIQNENTGVVGPPVVEVSNLVKHYSTGAETVKALRGVDFRADCGDFVVVHGPSGSGKTTFLNMVGCIDHPSSGTVEIYGDDVSKLSDGKLAELRRDKIGLVFQTFNLMPVLSTFENIEYPLLLQNVPRVQRRDRVNRLIDAVGLTKEARRRPNKLSGGQRQRVALARALVTEAHLVLADEPTGNLDTETSKRILGIMQSLNEDRDVAFIVVTHDPMVGEYAQRPVEIRDGLLSDVHSGD
jgi:putative ABC transport system ATP-binding protein